MIRVGTDWKISVQDQQGIKTGCIYKHADLLLRYNACCNHRGHSTKVNKSIMQINVTFGPTFNET